MDDPAIIESNQSWWGNQIGDKETELRSSFQNVICSLPLTTKNLQAAEDAAKKDLKWVIDKGIGDEITVSGSIENIKEANFVIKVIKDGENVLDSTFGVEWEAMSNGI
jgi:phage gp46-like protein